MKTPSFQKIVNALTTAQSSSKLDITIFDADGKLYPKYNDSNHYEYKWTKRFSEENDSISDRDSALLISISFYLQSKINIADIKTQNLPQDKKNYDNNKTMKAFQESNEFVKLVKIGFDTLIENFISSHPNKPIFSLSKTTPNSFNDVYFSEEFNDFLYTQLPANTVYRKKRALYALGAAALVVGFTLSIFCFFIFNMTTLALIIPIALTAICAVYSIYKIAKEYYNNNNTLKKKLLYAASVIFLLLGDSLSIRFFQAHMVNSTLAIMLPLGLLALCAAFFILKAYKYEVKMHHQFNRLPDALDKIEHITSSK